MWHDNRFWNVNFGNFLYQKYLFTSQYSNVEYWNKFCHTLFFSKSELFSITNVFEMFVSTTRIKDKHGSTDFLYALILVVLKYIKFKILRKKHCSLFHSNMLYRNIDKHLLRCHLYECFQTNFEFFFITYTFLSVWLKF